MTDPPPSDRTLDTSSSTTTNTPPDQPPLTRNASLSKLNAKAPEFVPMKSPSPPPGSLAASDPRLMIVPPPPPPPASLVHVYPPTPLPMPIPVRSPPPFPPHLNHHDQHHQHRHNNISNANSQGVSQSNNGNNNRHQKQHKEHHHQQEGAHSDKDQGNGSSSRNNNNNGLSDEATQKLINQVEYYFSDVNLATTEHLIRFIFKDPEGFVPISVVASFKKIKALISSNSQLAAVLRDSTKLVVSEDGKKVKRLHGLSSSDMEELQARIIVAENLPEDHCHQNLMKIFSAVGSVKSIRTCQPQLSNNVTSSASRSSKNDNVPYSNKLHAFVEYETVELAEKATAELNDEDSWRNGLRVRPLHKQVLKPAQGRTKRAGNESEEEDVSTSDRNQNEKQTEDLTELDVHSYEQGEEQSLEREGAQRKSRNRTRGKGRGRGHNHNNNPHHHHQHQTGRGSHMGGSSTNHTVNGEQSVVGKPQPPGPRMPDGTRGFALGRGRPVTVNTAA